MTTIINPLPYNIQNGQPIDAIPVMGDFNWIVSQVNANASAVIPTNASSIPTFVPTISVGGTANAITLTPTPSIAAYVAGQRFAFPAPGTNTGATTIATSGLAVRNLLYEDGTAMSGGELISGGVYDVIDNGTNYVLMNSSQGSGIVSWTPAIAFGGASTGITYTVQAGSYFKMGRFVWIAFYMALSSVGSSTGIVTITGLPFACTNSLAALLASPPLSGNLIWVNVRNPATAPSSLHLQMVNGTTTMQIYGTSTNGAQPGQVLFDTDFIAGSSIRGTGFYLV